MATPIKAQEAIAPAINLKPKTKIRGRQEDILLSFIQLIGVEPMTPPRGMDFI